MILPQNKNKTICNLTHRIIVSFKKKSHLLFAFLESKILQLTEKSIHLYPQKERVLLQLRAVTRVAKWG